MRFKPIRRDRKTATEGAEVTKSGRLFQTRAAATGKARSPTVRSRVWLTINDEDELEWSRWWASTSATWQSSSVRYSGADPYRHLYTRTDCLNAIRSEAFSQCSSRSSSQHLLHDSLWFTLFHCWFAASLVNHVTLNHANDELQLLPKDLQQSSSWHYIYLLTHRQFFVKNWKHTFLAPLFSKSCHVNLPDALML